MAWIKVKDMQGNISTIPQSVFENSYKGFGIFTVVDDPRPKTKQKVEVEANGDTEIHEPESNELETARQNKKKARV